MLTVSPGTTPISVDRTCPPRLGHACKHASSEFLEVSGHGERRRSRCSFLGLRAAPTPKYAAGPLGNSRAAGNNLGIMETPIEHLKTLPKHSEETWQGGLIRMPGWITGEGPVSYRAYIPMWVAVRADKVHGGQLLRPEERDLTAAVEALLAFASEDEFGGYRPGRVEVTDPALAEHLAKLLTDADIEVNLVEHMEAVERVIDAMAGFGEGERKHVPGPLEGEGVTVERMRRFAEAAAAFYRKAPWQYLTDTDLICTEQPEPPQGMECCVVLGAGRAAYGLGFYSSLGDYVSFRRAAGDARRTSLEKAEPWQVSFDPITEIPFKDADLWEDHGLPVADKRAYPLAMRYGSRGRMSRPWCHGALLPGSLVSCVCRHLRSRD